MNEKKQNKKGQDNLDMLLLDLDLESLPDETKKKRKSNTRKKEAAQPKKKELYVEQVVQGDRRQAEPPRRERMAPERQERKRATKKKKNKKMGNNELARVTYMFVTLFLVMIGYLVYFNVVRSKDVINSPYNVRQDLMADRVVRGKILDSNGEVLAETVVADDGTETRNYPYGAMYAHVVGYSSKGKAGVESIQNFNLLTSNAFILEKLKNEFQDQKNIGDSVITTLNTTLQKAAYDGLGSNKGAVVVMEASTGKILAMVSKPTYDPNAVAVNWESLNNDTASPLLNRSTMGQYAPGSTFKILTALEYMREHNNYNSYSHVCEGSVTTDGTTISCYKNTAHGEESLQDAFANSCNTSFTQIGLGLDYDKWKKTASDLLFGEELPCDLSYSTGKFQLKKNSDSAEVMMTAMGQGNTMVSPYHMALITSAIANGGTLMKPYLVQEITNYAGTSVKKYMPEKYTDLMTSSEAAQITEYMKAVVDYGTGTSLSGQSYSVAGKTGTAEVSMDKTQYHSWFVGFSNVDNPELVVSVIVENSNESGVTATSVAKKIFNAYYY